MAYKHGIYGEEIPTALTPMVSVDSGLPVVAGTAPLHLAKNPAEANQPVLCSTYKEAVEQLGYSSDWKNYTLCEMIYSHFQLFGVAPIVFINVLDQSKHKAAVPQAKATIENGTVTLTDPVILSSLTVKKTASDTTALVVNVDYTAAYDDNEKLVITPLPGGSIASATEIYVAYDKIDPSAVTKENIIGGVDVKTGKYMGLENIDLVYSLFKLVPGTILAPGWSHYSNVAAVMKAKTTGIDGHFEAICLCDVDTEAVTKYSDVSAWKDKNNITGAYQVSYWPMLSLSGKKFHMSTQMAGLMCYTDSNNEDVPYQSPSNKSLQCDSTVLEDGTEITLNLSTANYLNGIGVATALNYGGWIAWGNRTAIYPTSTDPKDAFVNIRRMFNWVNNTLITSFWSKIDNAMNKRLISSVLNSANVWLNGLTARGFMLGGYVELRSDENPTTDLEDGIIKFHVHIAPPPPAREIIFIQEYDTSYFAALFA